MESSYSRRLTEQLSGIASADIPESAYDAAGRILLDTYACALAGRDAPGIATVIDQMRDWGGNPEARLLFSDERLPMPNAAFANSGMIHAMDLDDIYTPGTLHLTSVIVPAMLAAADVAGASGRETVAAMIMGIEMAARIGVAEYTRRRGDGFLPSSLAGSFGAVFTAARLLDLTAEQTVHALGINYAQISGNRQALLDASLTKRLQPAFAARSALWAVALARVGITGSLRVFEGDAGYFKVYMNGEIPDAEELLTPFDALAVEHVSLKRFPSCGAAHSHQNAAETLREEEHLDPADIERVEIFNVAPIVGEPFRLNENPQVAAQFSSVWAVAHTLLRGRARLADYMNEAVRNDREVCELAQRIVTVPDPDDLPPPPELHPAQAGPGGAGRARYRGVIVHTKDGRRLMRCEAPSQTFPPEPFSWPEVERKFHDCAAFAGIGRAEAEAMIETVRTFGRQ